MSNTFSFTFSLPNGVSLKQVIPSTMEEATQSVSTTRTLNDVKLYGFKVEAEIKLNGL